MKCCRNDIEIMIAACSSSDAKFFLGLSKVSLEKEGRRRAILQDNADMASR